MSDIKEIKCSRCGAAMKYDPELKLLVCEHCGHSYDPGEETENTPKEANDTEFEGFDFASLNDSASVPSAEDLPIYICKSCGAEIVAAPEQFSLTCPYCDNNIVLSDKASGSLRPDGVIPFKFTSKELPAAVRRYYRRKDLLPRKFFSDSKMSEVTGVYVPFWVFSGNLSGTLEYEGSTSSSHRSGDYIYETTKYYDILRDVSVDFENLPIDASDKVNDAMMDSLEPFDLNEVKPFDISYLAGFAADRFDVPKNDIASRAQKRMTRSAEQVSIREAGRGYNGVHQVGGKLNAALDAKYLLFPVYKFSVMYDGYPYSFAVNGQTGKVVGNLPTDKKRKRGYFWKRVGIITLAVLLISFISYMLGA